MGDSIRAQRIAVLSGKGGVGKTVLAANIAAALQRLGDRTLLVDADLGLANADVILGLHPQYTLPQLLQGRCALHEALVRAPGGFDLLPAGSGLVEGTRLNEFTMRGIKSLLGEFEDSYDTILFDTGAGIGEVVTFFACLSDILLLVTTPEPTSMTDAYATVKILAQRFGCNAFHLVVNESDPLQPEQAGAAVARRLQEVTARFLAVEGSPPVEIRMAGSIPADPYIAAAVASQRLLIDAMPHAVATRLITRLAESLRHARTRSEPAARG